ncbi:uncharacterized protein LOC114257986 [Camellia sinensis]|uniref:uncharacterized protein LOC114257986 n=1 Tax=Camellia sinensis TaxID=4442 RepID=UPI001035841C|nr:uncharacterized protein LOC114257986 [Camellia sinensis]
MISVEPTIIEEVKTRQMEDRVLRKVIDEIVTKPRSGYTIENQGVSRFGKKDKLAPRYIGPFEILERVNSVAYRLALPPELSQVHNVFHISMVRRHIRDPLHVIDHSGIRVNEDLGYEEKPIRIIDRQVKQLRNKSIPMVKIEWNEHYGKDATWEMEEEMKVRYPELFSDQGKSSLGTKLL